MNFNHGFRSSRPVSWPVNPALKASTVAVAALAVVAALATTQVVVAACGSYSHGFIMSTAVPCKNAECAYWAYGVPNRPVPTCANPAGLTIRKVSVNVTAMAWSHCMAASDPDYPACTDVAAVCADYYMWADDNCTVQCTAAPYPLYCKGP